jgi:hypothetical protein
VVDCQRLARKRIVKTVEGVASQTERQSTSALCDGHAKRRMKEAEYEGKTRSQGVDF